MIKLSDFSSVLQLGVGLHAGTVLLQAIAEFASSPVSHRVERLARMARLKRARFERDGKDTSGVDAIESEILDTQSALELKKVQLFTEYKYAAGLNSIVALVLFGLLVWAAIAADHELSLGLACFIVFLSAGPAIFSLLLLWWRWHSNTSGIRASIKKLESGLFAIR
jgi:hypothetical protein